MLKRTEYNEEDIDAIRQVLENDIRSFLRRDRKSWLKTWVQEDRFVSIMECGLKQFAHSFDEFRRNIFDAMDADPTPVDADFSLKNLRVNIKGDTAWVTFEEIVTPNAGALATPSHSHNIRILERDGSDWRIVFHGCWAEPIKDTTVPAIEVDPKGNVLWLNGEAKAELKTVRGLLISHATLRASKPTLDKGLKQAIANAHRLTGFGQYNRAKTTFGGDVKFPVVLGEDEDGGTLFCWVKVADGRVYVLFGGERSLRNQIDTAQLIFGLSDAQTEVVRLLSRGFDLSEAADHVGISKNTARTHLRRVYEKTGVGSQIELLRLIISFDTPV